MLRLRLLTLIAILGILGCPLARGDLLGYWDFNNDTMNRSQGTQGTMTSDPAGFLDTQSYTTGTDVNAVSGTPAGDAIRFHDHLAILPDGNVEISGIDMTGQSDLSLSFAIRSMHTFAWHEHVVIGYRLGAGSWSQVEVLPEPSPTWSLYLADLPAAVDDQSDVSVRIEVREWANINEAIEFDNVLLTVIPEPATMGLLAIGATALLRRRCR